MVHFMVSPCYGKFFLLPKRVFLIVTLKRYKLTGDIDKLSDAAKQYSKFLRQLQCGGDLYPGQGPVCQYNATHSGFCSPNCIRGLEESGEYCGCSGGKGQTCPNSPAHIRCCLDTCSQELKMDLGFVLDASGSVGADNYALQLKFTKDLLRRVNVGENRTHVGIINYSTTYATLTWLDTDYDLQKKLKQVDKAIYYGSSTNTALALKQANDVFSYKRGLREVEEGATPVLFVITDGASNDQKATIAAAAVLKNKGIQIVSVGVGNGPNLDELYAICTPPVSDNYFAMSNYAALEQKLNQFTSKSCSEPAPVPLNTTVTGECGKDKYKFLKIEITWVGNKIMISVKLFNGKVKLFFSFTSRNPKDPTDFENYEQITTASYTQSTPTYGTTARNLKAANDEVTLIIDKPDTDEEFVYVGVKGVEDDNKFEVKFDDCEKVNCNSSPGLPAMKLSMVLMAVCVALFFPMK